MYINAFKRTFVKFFIFFIFSKFYPNLIFRTFLDLQWEDWSPWGQCTAHCTNGVGDRLQSRTRNKKNSAISGTSTQTESRPCNSVQFAGNLSSLIHIYYLTVMKAQGKFHIDLMQICLLCFVL